MTVQAIKSPKMNLWCEYMYTAGSKTFGNGKESAHKAGYQGNSNTLAQTAHKLVINPKCIIRQGEIRAKTAAKREINRQYCLDKLQEIVEDSLIERNRLTAISLLGDFTGDKRDKAPNPAAMAGIRERMEQEEITYRQEFTIKRCKQESTDGV